MYSQLIAYRHLVHGGNVSPTPIRSTCSGRPQLLQFSDLYRPDFVHFSPVRGIPPTPYSTVRADAQAHYARRDWWLDEQSRAATMEPTRRWACSFCENFSGRGSGEPLGTLGTLRCC